jgi:hypothetical protein
MVKTYRKTPQPFRKTRRNKLVTSNYSLFAKFQKEITSKFFEILLMIKLFHWKTYSYSTHKATDELYGKLNEHMDHFMEVLLGKTQIRMNFMNQKTIPLIDLDSNEKLIEKVDFFKSYLVNLNTNKAMNIMSNTDLLNIRDEILSDLNQFLYLLSLK